METDIHKKIVIDNYSLPVFEFFVKNTVLGRLNIFQLCPSICERLSVVSSERAKKFNHGHGDISIFSCWFFTKGRLKTSVILDIRNRGYFVVKNINNRVFPKLTDLTFLSFLYKIDITGFQNQQKKLPPLGIELTTPTPLLKSKQP